MIALCLNIGMAVCFGHVMKWATHRQANLLWVGLTNYLLASGICAVLTLAVRPSGALAFTIFTGAWAGVCYLISLLFYFAAVARLGMGLATAAIRLALALPVGAALVVWHERLSAAQEIGLVLVLVALPLLGGGNMVSLRGGLAMTFRLLAPLFVITGLGQLGNRIYTGGAPAANIFVFLASLYGGGALAMVVALARRPVRPRREDLLIGGLLGVVNLSTNAFLLLALRSLPTAVVFSISGTSSVVLATLTGMVIWKERLQGAAVAGVAASAVAVVLLAV